MPLYNKHVPESSFDVIICGGGLAGCVVASRLASADPELKILVIEGGQDNAGNPLVEVPALFPLNQQPKSTTTVWYKAKKVQPTANRDYMMITGGTLGGGSSINVMLYSRARSGDFDAWNTEGWDDETMLQYMNKAETFSGSGKAAVHGKSGPVSVTEGTYTGVKATDDFLGAATAKGYRVVEDLEDLKSELGFERAKRTNTKDGRRSDAASAYLHPLLKDGEHPNLHVLCEGKVNKILFDENKRAVGVEYTPNPDFQITVPNTTERPSSTVTASKMVILACGGLGSPQVLERSGVGAPEVLKQACVPLLVDLPGVGNNYQDHSFMAYPYKTNLDPDDTQDALWGQRITPEQAGPKMGWSSCDIHGKIRPTADEVATRAASFQKVWQRDYEDNPLKPLMLMANTTALFGDPSLVAPGQYFTPVTYLAYPYSRGYIHITGPDWQDSPDFDPGFIADKDNHDVESLIWAYKKFREIMRRTKMYRGEVPHAHPKFPAGSKAAIVDLLGQDYDPCSVKDLEYTTEDDKAIEKLIRENVGTTWHSMGTCKMAPREEGGVVDKDLNVYGVSGLKVIDLSIPPSNVAANTQMTTYGIGEKGADIVKAELGLA